MTTTGREGIAVLRRLPTSLESERVVVRRPTAGDEPALVQLFTDEKVRRFLGGGFAPDRARAWVEQIVAGQLPGQFVIVDRSTGAAVGNGDIVRKRGPWEISYQLLPTAWGMGLAAEAVALLVGWFFANTDEDVLIAVAQQENLRSRRLLERSGARHTMTFEQYGAVQARYEFRRLPDDLGLPRGPHPRPPSRPPTADEDGGRG